MERYTVIVERPYSTLADPSGRETLIETVVEAEDVNKALRRVAAASTTLFQREEKEKEEVSKP